MPKVLWPDEEAARIRKVYPNADPLILETGYGPSGAPHIGTFAEVARTSWVGAAWQQATGRPWELIAFSDDMDGLRKVPLNMPREALEPHLDRPLSRVPDPFGCHPSYAGHNNALLRDMLDHYGFRYTFKSSTEHYTSGGFNEGLSRIMANYEAVREIILPTIREEKRRDWSPFFPICERCGRINGTRVTGHDAGRLTVTYVCEGAEAGALADAPDEDDDAGRAPARSGCGHRGETSVLDGRTKVGWKVDWALRWYSLGVHYEMYGKDLIESAELSTRICRLIAGKGGHRGPVQSFYEMFLDEEGRKISKSVGRGLTVDSWLAAAPRESLLLFIFKDPRKAKKLSWDVVLRSADEYLQMLQRRYDPAGAAPEELRFIRPDLPETSPYAYPVSYSMLIGLVAAIGMPSPGVAKGYVHRVKGAIPGSDAMLERLAGHAITYAREQILPGRAQRTPTAQEAGLLRQLAAWLDEEREAEQVQTQAFDLARGAGLEPKEFFRLLYNVLTGQDSGPRFGPFVKLLGQATVAQKLREAAG